jgi:hypothetical protein
MFMRTEKCIYSYLALVAYCIQVKNKKNIFIYYNTNAQIKG